MKSRNLPRTANASNFGSDNNYEYKLYGYFSGDKVYEPASKSIYPEFVLKGYELISTNPTPIFRSQVSGTPDRARPPLYGRKTGVTLCPLILRAKPRNFACHYFAAFVTRVTSWTSHRSSRHDQAPARVRKNGFSCRGIPAFISNERNASPRTLKAYRHALTAFRAETQRLVEKMHGRRFSRLSLCAYETRAGAFLRAAAIFCAAHVLSISRRSQRAARSNPVREVQLPKIDKKLPLVLTRHRSRNC